MKPRALFAVALLLAGSAFAAEKPTAQHVVYLDDGRPVLIRLNVEIDGKPLAVVWREFLDHVFEQADLDKNGSLNESEAERVPPPQAVFVNSPFGRPDAVVARRGRVSMLAYLDGNRDGKVTPDELETAYRSAGGVPFRLQYGGVDPFVQRRLIALGRRSPPSSDALNEALFKTLDLDGDGKLSKAELTAAPELLHRFDADEDEVLTSEEVVHQQPSSGYDLPIVVGEAAPQGNSPFLEVKPGDAGGELARQMLKHYARDDKAKVLKRAELSELDDRVFAALDANSDGTLDIEELARFANREPDVEINLRLGRTRKPTAIEIVKPAAPEPAEPQDSNHVVLGNTRIELRVVLPGSDEGADRVRQLYRQQFTNADADNNGYLDVKEVERNPLFRDSFKAMDADGDGMLFLKEMNAYLDRQDAVRARALTSCVTLQASDQSRGLLDQLDANRDGRLGLRELRQAASLLKELDRDGDGCVSRAEIPRSYTLSATRGVAVPSAQPAEVVLRMGMNEPERPALPTRGPLWFRKMDRNRDGDVSRREFLGDDETFRKMDADGDGLISLAEAEKADAELRRLTTERP